MKTQFKILFTAVAALAITAFTATPAHASDGSFAITNVVKPATVITGAPTNSVDTNGITAGTGTSLDVRNYVRCGITVTGNTTTTNESILTLGLVRANVPGSPINTDWEYPKTTNLAVSNCPTAGMGTTTKIVQHFWLDETVVGTASHLGFAFATNAAAAGAWSNLTVAIDKKIIPIRYP